MVLQAANEQRSHSMKTPALNTLQGDHIGVTLTFQRQTSNTAGFGKAFMRSTQTGQTTGIWFANANTNGWQQSGFYSVDWSGPTEIVVQVARQVAS